MISRKKYLEILENALKLVSEKDFDAAIEIFTKLIDISKNSEYYLGNAYLERGKIYYELNQLELALSDINNAMKYIYYGENYYYKSLIYLKMGKNDFALAHLERAVAMSPDKDKMQEQYKNLLESQKLEENTLQENRKINISTCTAYDLIGTGYFNKIQAENIITSRDKGDMWYDIDSFTSELNLQPHEIVMLQDILEFPPKPNIKTGRKIEL